MLQRKTTKQSLMWPYWFITVSVRWLPRSISYKRIASASLPLLVLLLLPHVPNTSPLLNLFSLHSPTSLSLSLAVCAGWGWNTTARGTAVETRCTWAASWLRWCKLLSTVFTGPDVACKSWAATFSETQTHTHTSQNFISWDFTGECSHQYLIMDLRLVIFCDFVILEVIKLQNVQVLLPKWSDIVVSHVMVSWNTIEYIWMTFFW